MAKQVMDIQNSHGISQGESDENQRKWSEKQWLNRSMMTGRNYDYTRRNLNFEIVDGKVQKIDTTKSIDQKMREMVASRGMRWPNDPNPRRKPGQDDSKVKERNVAACFIFEGSRERMHEIAFGGYGVVDLNRGADNSHIQRKPEIEQWALDTYNWVGKKFGYENIASFYVHLDETNPHIHCDVLPVAMVKGKERISYQKVFGGESKEDKRRKWKGFHDSYYAEVGSKWGLDRGDDIEVTGAKHKTFEQYQSELAQIIKRAETRVKGLTSMVENLKKQESSLLNDVAKLERNLEDGHGEIAKLKVKKQELEEVESRLQEKQIKLDMARNEMGKLNLQIQKLEKEKVSLTNGMGSAIGAKLQSWGDSISRKVQGRDEKVREEAVKETRSQVMQEMVGVSGPWKDGHIPSPKEYAEQYRLHKQAAAQKSMEARRLEDENNELRKELSELRKENRDVRADRWLLRELSACPDRQLWRDLELYFTGSVWRFKGTYAGMRFSEPFLGDLENNSLSDVLTLFGFDRDDSVDMELRSTIAGLFLAMIPSGDVTPGGGGGGDTSNWGQDKDEDWFRDNFRKIFHSAKSKLKRLSRTGIKR